MQGSVYRLLGIGYTRSTLLRDRIPMPSCERQHPSKRSGTTLEAALERLHLRYVHGILVVDNFRRPPYPCPRGTDICVSYSTDEGRKPAIRQ